MIRGSMVALITPFNEDGSVNYKRLRELIDWHVDQQTDAILVLGTTAETPTLTVSEEDEIAQISIEQAKAEFRSRRQRIQQHHGSDRAEFKI